MPENKFALILASQSESRKAMLKDAGLSFSVIPADINEDIVLKNSGKPAQIAQTLADQKALKISHHNPDALVIGSDQILEFEGQLLSKAKDEQDARAKLNMLKGKTHRLISAVCVAHDNEIIWRGSDEAVLTMRDFEKGFLDKYCAVAGDALTRSVGAYELEKHGSWLFSSIEGNHFTILGMPLILLLNYLQDEQGYTL